MFAFEVEYLTHRAVASERHNRETAEWPPHPARLFSALVAAYSECDMGAAEREALEWLERLPPPSLTVADAAMRSVVPVFVPVNDNSAPDKVPSKGFTAAVIAEGLKVLPERRSRQQRSLPSVWLHERLVHFHWSAADTASTARHRPAFDRLAAHVTYLGHSSSLVRLAVCDEPPTATLVPDDEGTVMLRVPTPGRLNELEDAYRRAVRPTAGLYCSYRTRQAAITPEPPGTVFGEMIVFRREAGPRLPLSAACRLTTTIRQALQSLAAQPPREVICGHELEGAPSKRPHIAIVPLANVGAHRHADGEIKGFSIVLPCGLDHFSEDRRHIAQALVRLKELQMGSCGKWTVQRLTPAMFADTLDSLRVDKYYTDPTRRWATVTPMLLDRFPKDRPGQSATDIIRQACTRIGLPAPVSIDFDTVSWLRGAPPSHQFDYRYKSNLPQRHRIHALLEFGEPVRGPIILCAGRYVGLGLCRHYETREGASHDY